MLEVETIDDVGRALDRAKAHGVMLTATLGRHVNDDMVSFYMLTPGAFSLEYGAGGKIMDWSEHVVFETTRGSHWGHEFAMAKD
jgi:3,4-dihydroxy-9,10-secoandrosta-1,3,5(10)-triene-9,17-dione 4,5-dioxygenase